MKYDMPLLVFFFMSFVVSSSLFSVTCGGTKHALFLPVVFAGRKKYYLRDVSIICVNLYCVPIRFLFSMQEVYPAISIRCDISKSSMVSAPSAALWLSTLLCLLCLFGAINFFNRELCESRELND